MTPGKLGRLPHDPVALAAAPAHQFGALPPPQRVNRAHILLRPGLYNNDSYPDCTAASMANAARGVAALNGYALVVDPITPLAFYANCIGNPAALATTDGASMLAVLQYQEKCGFSVGPQSLVAHSGTIDPRNRAALACGISRLGGGWWGVTLRERDMETSSVWDTTPGQDDGAVVGGHALMAWDYTGLKDTSTVRVATWGGWKPATWRWVDKRLEEAYGLCWRQLARPGGKFYNGLTADGLVADL